MAALTTPPYLRYGINEPLPLDGFPEGKIRLRIRNDEFAQAFVKTPDGIRGFYFTEEDGKWKPFAEFGRNEKL